jgi:hypothetical protein
MSKHTSIELMHVYKLKSAHTMICGRRRGATIIHDQASALSQLHAAMHGACRYRRTHTSYMHIHCEL